MTEKTLFLFRHAKSSWEKAMLDDRDRPLNGRGRRAAVRMGRLMQEQRLEIDLVLCSTSKRTRETVERVFDNWKSPPHIEFRDALYLAAPAHYVEILQLVAEPTRCVMLIGHNPGLEDFFEQLTGERVHFPTAALAQIEPDVDQWTSFNEQTRGRLIQVWRPRELDQD